MPWYAFDAVDDALEATREFLFPFTWGRWLRLAVIVFFLGGGGGGLNNLSNVSSSVPSDGGTTPGPAPGPTPDVAPSLADLTGLSPDTVFLLGTAALGLLALLVLVLVLASSVMPFVLIDAIRTNDVRVRGPFKQRFGKGVRFLLFQLGVGLLFAAPFVLAIGYLVLTDPSTAAFESFLASLGLAGILGVLALFVVGALFVGLFLGFTRQFVVPVMIATNTGVLPSWRQFWPTLRREWKQFVVYVFVRFVLQLGVGIAQFVVMLVLGVVVVVATVLVGLLVVTAFGGLNAALGSAAGLAALGVLTALALLALLAVSLPVKILVQTYFTTYELSVLGGVEERFALLPRRPGEGDADGGPGTSDHGENGGGRGSTDGEHGPDSSSGGSTSDFVWGDESSS